MAKFRERAFLDLSDALGADAEFFPDLDEPLRGGVEAEAGADHVAFSIRESGTGLLELSATLLQEAAWRHREGL